ncbi:MAG: tetratricopeptide repeat protein [Ignavibacteriae bacterium]|nr:tetratricopeptide repeat protein [Ignavibacteriota bacterium]
MKKAFQYLFIILLMVGNTSQLFAQYNLEKAKLLANNKKFEEAKNLLEEIIDENDKNAEAHFVLGKVFMVLREFEDASDSFEEAVELEKDNSEYHFRLGSAYGADAQQSSFITKAILAPKIKTQFEIAVVAFDSNNIDARVGVAQFYLQAPGFMGGDVEKALEQGKAILTLDEPQGRMILAQVYQAKEQMDLAEEQYRLLLDKFGNDKKYAGIYNAYGYRLLSQKKYNEAIEAFEKQVELLPERANSYDSLGDGYRKAGKLKLAMEQYKKALEIDPEFESSKDNLEELEDELK